MWLLPWERWLPAWIVGPAMCIGAVWALASGLHLHWWDYVLLPPAAVTGVYTTYVWFKQGRHFFRDHEPRTRAAEKEQH